jgi:hypothetical protein
MSQPIDETSPALDAIAEQGVATELADNETIDDDLPRIAEEHRKFRAKYPEPGHTANTS